MKMCHGIAASVHYSRCHQMLDIGVQDNFAEEHVHLLVSHAREEEQLHLIKNVDMFLSTAIKSVQRYQIDTCQNWDIYLKDQICAKSYAFHFDYRIHFFHNSNPLDILTVMPIVGHEVS